VKRLRKFSELPGGGGVWISNAEQVAGVHRYADAVVVGSAIVAEMERLGDSPELVRAYWEFLTGLNLMFRI
jgi:tryptophan synthase alpha chain